MYNCAFLHIQLTETLAGTSLYQGLLVVGFMVLRLATITFQEARSFFGGLEFGGPRLMVSTAQPSLLARKGVDPPRCEAASVCD